MDDERRNEVLQQLTQLEARPLAERAEGYAQLLDALRTELEAAPAGGSAP